MENLLRDLRFSVRNLKSNPGFTAAALLCLALGIGASSAIFSVVYAVLLKPLPFADPDRVVMIWDHFLLQDTPKSPVSAQEFMDVRGQSRVFTEVGAWAPQLVSLSGRDEPQQLVAGRASASLFQVLGVKTSQGRLFTPEEDRPGNNKVALLSYQLWKDRFGSEPGVVGGKITLDGSPYVVAGVLPEGFELGPFHFDLWIPQGFDLAKLPPRNIRLMSLAGRLKPGVTAARARAELDLLAHRFQQQYPDIYTPGSGWGMHAVPIHEDLVGNVRRTLLILFGAVGLVLLIACSNVANLLLARATSRHKEVAIRTALGASRAGLIRQFLTEGLLLSFLGALLGLLLAFWITRLLTGLNPGNIPRLGEVRLDGGVLLFALGIVMVTGVVFGLLPALQTSGRNLRGPLQEGGKTSASGAAGQRARSTLIVLEIAVALIVLIAAGLSIQSFRRLLAVDPGFRSDNVFTLQLSLSRPRYPQNSQVTTFQSRLLERVGTLPGVESASLTSQLPLVGINGISGDISVEGRLSDATHPDPVTAWRMVTPDYFKTMGIQVLEGRAFAASDTQQAPGAVIVDEELAKRLWPAASPLGRRLRLNAPTPQLSEWRSVVGVVRHVRQEELGSTEGDQLYVPLYQYPSRLMFMALHTRAAPEALTPALRQAIWAIDKDLPIIEPKTMDERLRSSLSRPRFNMSLFSGFALTALLLTVVGVYGVMAYSVAQRTRDMGIRMALGADRKSLVRLVVLQGLTLTGAGVAIGLAVSWILARVMASLLYGVEATDLATFTAVTLLLGALAVVASYIPARRAARVDPVVSLRYE
jgi:putative ABC transport system permease protein